MNNLSPSEIGVKCNALKESSRLAGEFREIAKYKDIIVGFRARLGFRSAEFILSLPSGWKETKRGVFPEKWHIRASEGSEIASLLENYSETLRQLKELDTIRQKQHDAMRQYDKEKQQEEQQEKEEKIRLAMFYDRIYLDAKLSKSLTEMFKTDVVIEHDDIGFRAVVGDKIVKGIISHYRDKDSHGAAAVRYLDKGYIVAGRLDQKLVWITGGTELRKRVLTPSSKEDGVYLYGLNSHPSVDWDPSYTPVNETKGYYSYQANIVETIVHYDWRNDIVVLIKKGKYSYDDPNLRYSPRHNSPMGDHEDYGDWLNSGY